ncbi:MAG: hypothetical protein KDD64_07865 [Bdellovibrionales bacterium]|nr:hypothetical protein [Bdellovibrionales bacterium]
MCVSSSPADFVGTKLYAGEITQGSSPIHVIGYQNTAQDLSGAPNCMMIPFQSSEPMTEANVLDTSYCPHIITDMVDAVMPVRATRGMKSFGGDSKGVQIFDHDIYTVVPFPVGANIFDALRSVRNERRPRISEAMIEFWERHYPGYHLALCCFNNAEAKAANPMLWRYRPQNPDVLVAPAIDAHDGNPPDLMHQVELDHKLVLGSDRFEPTADQVPVRYRDTLTDELRRVLPFGVIGREFYGRRPNGDFLINVSELRAGNPDAVQRGILSIAS